MAKLSLDLSDGIAALRREFDDYTHEARVLSPEDARSLQACCALLFERARQLENEVSAKRWNEEARADRQLEERRIIAELSRPETNLIQFPVIPRPFHDGRFGPGGAA